MGLQALQNWVMTQLGMTAATTAGEGARTAAVATGEATRAGVQTAGATAAITANAAVAASGAYASTVVIPFIGPVAAPVAAGVALAAVLGMIGLISAKGGAGRIEKDGQLAELHKDEMVLPAHLANPLRDSLSGIGPTRSGLSTRVAQTANDNGGLAGMVGGGMSLTVQAIDTQSGMDFIMNNRRGIGKAMQRVYREGMKMK
jgi:hypothetical protein